VFDQVVAEIRPGTSAPGHVGLRVRDAHDANVDTEASVLAEMGEGERAQSVSGIACVVEDEEAEGIVDREGIAGLDEGGVVTAEAVVGEAAKAGEGVYVLTTDGGAHEEGDGVSAGSVGDGEVGNDIDVAEITTVSVGDLNRVEVALDIVGSGFFCGLDLFLGWVRRKLKRRLRRWPGTAILHKGIKRMREK